MQTTFQVDSRANKRRDGRERTANWFLERTMPSSSSTSDANLTERQFFFLKRRSCPLVFDYKSKFCLLLLGPKNTRKWLCENTQVQRRLYTSVLRTLNIIHHTSSYTHVHQLRLQLNVCRLLCSSDWVELWGSDMISFDEDPMRQQKFYSRPFLLLLLPLPLSNLHLIRIYLIVV